MCWCNATSSRPSSSFTASGLSSSRTKCVQSYFQVGVGFVRALTHAAVLETTHDVFLFRAAESRSSLPHLLSPTLCPSLGRIVGPLHGTLCLAPHLRFHNAPLYRAHVLHGLPRLGSIQHPDIHLEQEESRYHAKLFGAAGVQGTLSSLGSARLLAHYARDGA